MEMHKQKVSKVNNRSNETVTEQRALQLATNGANCAKFAKSKGQSISDSKGYIYLMGDNNTAAWMSGWDAEWEKKDVKII